MASSRPFTESYRVDQEEVTPEFSRPIMYSMRGYNRGAVDVQRAGKTVYIKPPQRDNNPIGARFSSENSRKLTLFGEKMQGNSSVMEAGEQQHASPSNSSNTFHVETPTTPNGLTNQQERRVSQPSSIVHPTDQSAVSLSSVRNILVKASIPHCIVTADNQMSSHDSHQDGDVADGGKNYIITYDPNFTRNRQCQGSPEGFDDLITVDDGSKTSEVSDVVLVETSQENGPGYILKEGERYTFLKKSWTSPTHSLVVEATPGKNVVRGLLAPKMNPSNSLLGGGVGSKTPKSGDHPGKANTSGLGGISPPVSAVSPSVSISGGTFTSGEIPPQKNLRNSRLWNYAEKTTGPLKRPPLHRGGTPQSANKSNAIEDGPVLLPTRPTDEEEANNIKRATLANNPKIAILCGNCGSLTRSWKTCALCHQTIPAKPTWHNREPAGTSGCSSGSGNTNASDSKSNQSTASIDKVAFYGNKLNEQCKTYGNLNSRGVQMKRKTVNSRRGTNTRGGKVTLKKYFTETVTISSDEDEESQADKVTNDPTLTSAPSSSSPEDSMSMPTVGDSPSPSPAPTAAQPTCSGLSRRERMEDKAGNRVVTKKKPAKQVPLVMEPEVNRVDIEARGLRIGSMRGAPYKPVLLSMEAIHIDFETSDDTVSLVIHSHEIIGCHAHLSPAMPAVFLYVTPSCGSRVRDRCKMTDSCGPYFDPAGDADAQKRIIILFKKMTSMLAAAIESIFRRIAKKQSTREGASSLYENISLDDANKILLAVSKQNSNDTAMKKAKSAGKVVQANEVSSSSKDSPVSMDVDPLPDESPSVFTGPVEKLIVYPLCTPPATGAITVTNEDVFCLNEGEFLNDVIIDFYLKYLIHNELEEEDRNRTHIFNSFFYKRLTQRQSRSSSLADDVTLPANLKRHARVKTWTRHVDIFSKDFVIVPINEHSHWFLAIICFPGLREPQYVKSVHPKTKNLIQQQKQTCVLVMDSLAGPSRQAVIRILRDYLQVEWDTKKKETDGARVFNKTTVRGSTLKVPQQNNYSDCGVFILHYAESFFKNPIGDYTFPLSLQHWFPVEAVRKKRKEIRDIIMNLKVQQEAASDR